MVKTTSQHILNTAATLLGLCLFVITARHITNVTDTNIIDKLTAFVAILLALSCFFSFSSLRTKNLIRERRSETIADFLFMISLLGILVIILTISFNFIG